MRFKFETGEIIEVYDKAIIKIIRADKRYKEITDVNEANAEVSEGDKTNAKVQK